MNRRKWMVLGLLALLVTALGGLAPPAAQAIDESKIPHYFGPYPNWALSPLPVKTALGNYSGGIRKFRDTLPRLGQAGANNLGQYIPVAVPDTTTYPGSDYYEIAVVQYREKMHSDLPPTLLRGYVQLSTTVVAGARVALSNALLNGTNPPISGFTGVTAPHYLGPIIVATKDRPVRVLFRNLLPTGTAGDLFLPVDSTFMGAGEGQMAGPYDIAPAVGGDILDAIRNPMCTEYPKMSADCFTDNRATLHLHGGTSPWISDGTPHQWTTPASQTTPWPKGVSVRNVPDMPDPGPGALTFFYTNQQSARLLFYHDHAWGITRLNVYAGEAAGYLITDSTENSLISRGLIPGSEDTIPLVIQDRTFVPGDRQLYGNPAANPPQYGQDPTWDKTRWGGFGNFWYHHVYMTAQNPGDPSGMSTYGRWMYGPWFWPPARDTKYGPIANPRYNMNPATNFTTPLATPCDLDVPSTWQYQVDPFCEPQLIPGTPNISGGMEQFNDTPMVNGTPYPTTTLDPKPYRLRILNAANDRFFNLQWYVADASGTEVALNAAQVAAAQNDPNVFPTPDTALSPVGPQWIQIGTEGGFLPAPAVIANQPITWIVDPTRFDFGNVDQHALVLAPAERADTIVDFSQYAGKTLILYNDAPAAYPARVASYDYYTGAPDLSPVGAPYVLPGYGPNTRTIMQVKVNSGAGTSFNLANLQAAFAHNSGGTGVFESGQHPVIVGQAAYNSAYGTTFAASSWCNAPGSTVQRCDGLARISDQGGDLFGFNTIFSPAIKVAIPLQPKAIHDEQNASTFDEYGRMQANLGIESVPATPGGQNVNLMAYVFPPTEVIDATALPSSTSVTPITSTSDGTQIWKITHNGVDTHPIHFHLYDVQLLNRVTWDNIIIPADPNELGWKDTVRVSPLEDTIVALRPVIPVLPFDLPNSIRLLSPMLPDGAAINLATLAINLGVGIPPTNGAGEPVDIYNHRVNFGAEYVWHCHILSHEEMDMMRPVTVALPPVAPANLTASASGTGTGRQIVLAWADSSQSETGFEVQRATSTAGPWSSLATVQSATGPQVGQLINYSDPIGTDANPYLYRVRALNLVGDTWNYADPAINNIVSGGFPTVTAYSAFSNTAAIAALGPIAPSNLSAVAGPAAPTPAPVTLSWSDNSTNETGFTLQRSTSANFATFATFTLPAVTGTGTRTFVDTTAAASSTYYYRIRAFNGTGTSNWSNTATVTTPGLTPPAPANLRLVTRTTTSITLAWNDVAGEQGYYIERSPGTGTAVWTRVGQTAANTLIFRNLGLAPGTSYRYRIQAFNAAGVSPYSTVLTAATLP